MIISVYCERYSTQYLCQCIISVFRVLGIYNFGCLLEDDNVRDVSNTLKVALSIH